MFLIYLILGVITAWLGVNSILVGLSHWATKGAFLPVAAGGLIALLAVFFLVKALRRLRSSRRE